MIDKILHFGVLIKKSDKNKICRKNYAVVDEKSIESYGASVCEEHQEKCLINYDKNMAYFKQITKDDFEDALQALVASNKNIRQVFDLNECNKMCGIYIMVLDEYKQVYIGQSRDIKKRIMSHWNKHKSFDRLLCGNVNDSVLSIDSFGALDTTRVFVLETDNLDSYEIKLQKKILSGYKLNRMAGGVPEDRLDLITKALDRNTHDLRDFHNEEFAEQYEKELDIITFIPQGYCKPEELTEGDFVCLERTNRGKLLPQKYFGKVIKATKSRLWVYRYCSSILGYSCIKNKKVLKEEIWVKRTMLFTKVSIEEKKEIRTFWRSKKFPHIEA
ncbi:MAG: hypothetical protein E7574_06985 [Ruminococcaceae bacterium]|nr:hypothetical protein [Oscillospiraceae bacterium]